MKTSTGKVICAAALLLFALNGCAHFNWQDTKSALGTNCMWSGLACIPHLGMELYDGAKDLTKKKGYEIDGKFVSAEEVKAQAYQYKPENPEKAEVTDAAEAKETSAPEPEQTQSTLPAQPDKPAETPPNSPEAEKQ
jgi:hypothetical protein